MDDDYPMDSQDLRFTVVVICIAGLLGLVVLFGGLWFCLTALQPIVTALAGQSTKVAGDIAFHAS